MYSPVSFMLEILWKEYIKMCHESIGMHTLWYNKDKSFTSRQNGLIYLGQLLELFL